MNLKEIFKMEYKRMNINKSIFTTILLTVMLFTFYIGQLGQIEFDNMWNIQGIDNLIRVLSNSSSQKYLLTETLLGVGFFVSIVIFSAFQGLPSCLSSYTRSRDEGSLMYLLITPMKIKSIILATTIFAFFKTVCMAIVPFLFLCGFSLYCGANINISSGMIVTVIFILSILFSSFLIINSLLWIFNGSQLVINIFKYTMLAFILISAPISTRQVINMPSISMFGGMFLIIIMLISIILLSIVKRVFDKEKMVLNSKKFF